MSELVFDPAFLQYLSSTFDTSNVDPSNQDKSSVVQAILDDLNITTGVGYLFGGQAYVDNGDAFAEFVINQLPPELHHEDIIAQLDLRVFSKYLENNPNDFPDATKFVVDNKITSRLTDHFATQNIVAFDSVTTDKSDDELRQGVINNTSVGTVPDSITYRPLLDPTEVRSQVLGIEQPQEDAADEPEQRTASLQEQVNAILGGGLPTSESQVTAEDLQTIFGYDDTFASAATIFNDYQLKSILGVDEGAVETYKFRWNEDPPPGMGGRGVTFNLLQLRKQLRSMDPKYVAALSDKLAIAGYYERIGAQGPQIDGNGSDVIFQRAVSELVYDSVTAGGEALNSVLSRQLNQRLNNVNEQFKTASLSGLQQDIMQLGTYVLGRPLTSEQAMEAIRTLPEFQTGFVEEQLAAGVAPDVITTGAQELDETEQQQLLQYVYDANRREAQRFGANNWAGMFAQEAQRRIRGVQSPQEVPFGVGEGTRPQDISAGDVMGDSNG